jgi:hypothetical protein
MLQCMVDEVTRLVSVFFSEKVMERGERIDVLLDKTEELDYSVS